MEMGEIVLCVCDINTFFHDAFNNIKTELQIALLWEVGVPAPAAQSPICLLYYSSPSTPPQRQALLLLWTDLQLPYYRRNSARPQHSGQKVTASYPEGNKPELCGIFSTWETQESLATGSPAVHV